MKIKEFRKIYKKKYVFVENSSIEEDIRLIERPVIQGKILWFWITIKTFWNCTKREAEDKANKLMIRL